MILTKMKIVGPLTILSLTVGVLLLNHQNPVNPVDKEVNSIVHPKSTGLVGCGADLNQSFPLALRLLGLPQSTTAEKMSAIVNKRLAEASGLLPKEEALYVLQIKPGSISDECLRDRIALLDTVLCEQKYLDPRLGTHCAGFDWISPFKLQRNHNT